MAFVKNDCNKIGKIMTDKMKILKEFEAKTKNVSEYNDYHFFDFILDELIKARNELSKLHQPTVISAVCGDGTCIYGTCTEADYMICINGCVNKQNDL